MLISKIRRSIELSAGDRRIAARMTLGFVAAILCLMLVLAGASLGLTGSLALSQPSPSASPSGSPSGPAGEAGKIFLLNPSKAYEPASDVQEPPQPNADPADPTLDDPKVSDKFDGSDSAYHIVAVVKNPPPTALVEAYWQTGTANEVTIGEMTPAPGSPGTYEFFWDIPSNIGNQPRGFVIVRLYQQTPNGFEQVSEDSVQVRIADRGVIFAVGGPVSAAETVELSWPSQGGALGFYKGAGTGAWRTFVEGTASAATEPVPPNDPGGNGAAQIRLFYSTTPPGVAPEFTSCGQGGTGGGGPGGSRRFGITCTLDGTDRPSQVTAIAAVAMENHDDTGRAPRYSQEAADVHVVAPYMQRVEDMTLELTSNTASDSGRRRHVVQGSSSDVACTAYMITVRDALDRPVQGANVDVHLRGPGDSVQFGDEADDGRTHSGYASPAKGHSKEAGRNCDGNNNWQPLQQGDHNVPGADDTKHLESAATGTGLSGGSGASAGQWKFQVWSERVGDTQITAWVDDEPVASDSEKREADDDLPEATESSDTNFVQWLPSAVTVTFDPLGATAAAGSCQKFIVRVRGGTSPIRAANVDVHATGPTNDLDFCDPGDGSPRRAPNAGVGHNAEDNGEMAHAGQPPVAQHTEGVTSDQGNFVIGITSPQPGDTTLTAWYDAGEDGFDDDELSGEASGSATTNWVASTGDAAISFVNPSPYGSAGTNVGRKQDVDSAFHIVTRVSSVTEVPGVEIFYRSGSNPLVKIADATRAGQTDTWEAYWTVDVADGSYTLVARIRDTTITAEQAVTVRNQGSMVDPTVVPFETAEITAPLDGQRATFTNRRLPVRGVASSGAEGVVLYYTKTGPINTPVSAEWLQCGTSTLPSSTAPKEFTLDCTLAGGDQPALVTGIAAIAYNCIQNCTASQTNHSGDAHRVFGVDANPSLTMEPAEAASGLDECVKFVVSLTDQTGQPIPNQNVDVHMTGPGNSGNFCAPEDGSGTPRRAPNDGGHLADGDESDEAYHEEAGGRVQHTEAETTGNGRLIFAIESATAGDTQLTVWLDENDNDAQDDGERSDVSVMHWEADDGGPCDVNGTDGPDFLEGTDASERICGFGGDDTIRGGGGADVVLGGAGNDLLRGGTGGDIVRGAAGNDRALGGGDNDRVFGGGGRDTVKGHGSDDRLRGNRGNDRLNGGSGRDDCSGGGGRDRLRKCETGTRSFAARTRPI